MWENITVLLNDDNYIFSILSSEKFRNEQPTKQSLVFQLFNN